MLCINFFKVAILKGGGPCLIKRAYKKLVLRISIRLIVSLTIKNMSDYLLSTKENIFFYESPGSRVEIKAELT